MSLRPPHPISETRLEFDSTKRTKPKDSKKQPNNVVQSGNSITCKYLTKHVNRVMMGLHFEVFEVNSPIMRAHNSDHGEATMTKKRKLTKQEQRFYDKWVQNKSQLMRRLAERHNAEVEVIDIPMVDEGPIAWPRVQEEN